MNDNKTIDVINALYNFHTSDEYYNKDEYYGFSSQIGPITNYDVEQALEFSIKALEEESKTGQWIEYGIPRCGEQHYKCTACGYYINFGQWGEVYTKQFKYCPNCKAKMR